MQLLKILPTFFCAIAGVLTAEKLATCEIIPKLTENHNSYYKEISSNGRIMTANQYPAHTDVTKSAAATEETSTLFHTEHAAGENADDLSPTDYSPSALMGYKNGFFIRTEDDAFSLKSNLRLQTRYEIDDFEEKEDSCSLTIRRGRFTLKGNAFGDIFDYFFQLDSHSTGKKSEISTLELIDYYTDVNIPDLTSFRLGQMRVWSNRQWITPDSKLQMIDFSVASDEFNLGRQLGAMVHDDLYDKKLEYNLGMYTGNYNLFNGEFKTNDELLWIVRTSYNPLGNFGYTESDIEFSESPLAHISFSASFGRKDAANINLEKQGTVSADNLESLLIVHEAGFKYKGFSLIGEYYWRKMSEFSENNITDTGYFVQTGYFVVPGKIEATTRYSHIDFDASRSEDKTEEITLGINYFFSEHATKIQFNVVRIDNETLSKENTDYKFILQFQFTL